MDDASVKSADETEATREERPAPTTRSAHRAAARAAADRHSRRVRTFKIALPVLGLGAVVLIGGYAWFKLHVVNGLDVRNVLFTDQGLTMVEPRLSGRSEGRTYDVSAAKAYQSVENPKIIRLEGIDGRLEMADGVTAKIDSVDGRYDGSKEMLDLGGGLTVTTSNGWRTSASTATIDLTIGNIRAAGSVRIAGPTATIESDTLDLTESGHHAVFEGNVRMTLQPGGGESVKADAPAPSATR